MSNLSELLPAGAGAKSAEFVASGTLSSGQTVILQSNGTVKAAGLDSVTEALGTAVEFDSATIYYMMNVSDTSASKVVVFYRDGGNNNYATAIVGTISGTSVSFGSKVVLNAATIQSMSGAYDSIQNKIVIAYRDVGDSDNLNCVVGTISGTSISFGAESEIASNNPSDQSMTFDSNAGKFAIFYKDTSDSGYGKCRVLTVSGDSVSAGTITVVESHSGFNVFQDGSCFDSSNNKVILTSSFNNGSAIRAYVGTISGTSISFGSFVTVHGSSGYYPVSCFDTTNNKVIIAYEDIAASGQGKAVVGTVSGTSMSVGSAATFETGSVYGLSIAFNTTEGKAAVVYRDEGNSNYGTYAIGTVSGTSISFATPVVYQAGSADQNSVSYNSTANRFFINYYTGSKAEGIVLRLAGTESNNSDFVGITNQAINNSASGEVVVEGGVVTNSQLLPFAYTGSLGSAAVYQSTATEYQGIAFDSSNNKIVVAYKDDSNQHGTCAVGTVSGTSISWGTPVVFAAASTSYVDVTFDSSNNKVVIVYSDVANSEYGTAIVGTVSGTSISFGSEVVFASAATVYIKAGFDSNANKVVVAYSDNGNSGYGTAIVGTVSGTSISFGTEVVFDSTGTLSAAFGGFVFDSTNNKVVIPYSIAGGGTYGIVGTVSGTSISFGTRVAIGSVSGQNLSVAFDSNAGKVVINYRDANNSDYTGSVVGTVSGTSISFGTELVIEEVHNLGATTFDSSDNKIIYFYKSSNVGYYRIGTVSGTSISYGSAVSLISNNLAYMAATFDSNQNTSVVVYKDTGNSNYGTAKGLQVSGAYPNLVPNTTYYVQDDGTLATTSSSVTAGKALSSTTLLLKG